MSRRFGTFLVLLIMSLGAAMAQTGSLRVRVLDDNGGEPLPGATVTLSSEQQLIAPTFELCSMDGRAEFPVLRAGSGYIVEVAFPGYATQRIPDVRVRSNEIQELVVRLPQELRERVEVTARRNVVELETAGTTSKFSAEFMQNLPTPGRFYQNVLTLAPGVLDSDADGNPNVHGARSREFRAIVGGVSNTDPLTGEWLSYVNTESIEEMEIITSGAGVEFGRASGGFARILQKQGSNEFEGQFTYYYRSSDLDGAGAADFVQSATPAFEWHQPGLQISGPIVKDRLWFRLSHEYLKREDPLVLSNRIDIITRSQTTNSDQITWQASPRNKLALQFQSDPLTIENFGLTARVPSESSQRLERGGPSYSMNWTAPVSSRLLVDTTVAYQDHERNLLPQDPDAAQDCVFFNSTPSGGGFPILNTTRCFNSETGLTSGAHPTTSRDRRQRLTLSSQATYFKQRFLGATHRLKLGLVVENERYFRDLERRPDINFFTIPSGFTRIGYANATVAAPKNSSGRAVGTNWALYAEDQIRPAAGLAVTLGLRVDREEINSVGRGRFDPVAESRAVLDQIASGISISNAVRRTFTAFADIRDYRIALARSLEVDPTSLPLGAAANDSQSWVNKQRAEDINLRQTNFSPRVSIAWDPWKNGKTKLSISAGRYYDKIVLAVPLVEIEPPESNLVFQTFGENGYIAFDREGGFSPAVKLQAVDRDLQTPYQDEFTVSFERALWQETSIKLSYVRRKFRDQLQDVDINHAPGDHGRCLIATSLGQPVITISEDEGDLLVDPYTGNTYVDTDPGNGDGLLAPGFEEPYDDCTGNIGNEGGPFQGRDFEFPDGLPDLYVQNPGWGEILLVGNFNASDYEAYVLELVRRFYRNWQLDASYTWSEAVGDAEDFTQVLGNERNLRDDERGFLDYDQRHVVSLSAVALTRWGLRLGGTVRWESGVPYSLLEDKLTVFARPPEYGNLGDTDQRFRFRYPTGRRNDQRNPSYWTVDLRLAKEFKLARGGQLQLTGEVFNLLNDDTLILDDRINGESASSRRFGRRYQLGLRLGF